MPVPKVNKTAETVNDMAVETVETIQTAPVVSTQEGGVVEGVADASAVNNDTATATAMAPKGKRGRKAGAAPAVVWDQAMFNAMRREARRLASQQLAAGIADTVDPSTLLESIKSRYPGFEAVDRARLVSKYKEGQKQISKSAKAEEIATGGMEHPLYLPPLTDSRGKIDFLALDAEEAT